MDGNKPLSPIPLPGIALALLMVGVIAFSDNPFKPTRPGAGTDITSTAEDVRARLWQDPFDAVETHIKDVHSTKPPEASKTIIPPNAIATIYLNKHRICQFRGASDVPGSEDNPLVTTAHSIEELRCQIQRDVVNDSDKPALIHVLAVMVPGGPYAEEHEARIRSRYAVITGLSQAGYIPKDSEHIGYLNLENSCRGLPGENCDKSGLIPYEWFVSDRQSIKKKKANYSNTVLVVWLDDAAFSQSTPLANLDRFKNTLTPGPHETYISKTGTDLSGKELTQHKSELKALVQLKFDVIGPAGSATLVNMFKEAVKNDVGKNEDNACVQNPETDNDCIRIISPRATIDYAAITEIIYGSSGSVLNPKVSSTDISRFNSGSQSDKDRKTSINRFKLIRTIPTDSELVDELLCQLLYRGVNLYRKDLSGILYLQSKCRNKVVQALDQVHENGKSGRGDPILLIGEWDTAYSRNYKKLFTDKLKGTSNNDEASWFYSSNYLRGIDGITGQEGKISITDDKQQDGKKIFRRPIGPNQFDYLRRLGDNLTNSLKEGRSFRAIGIVGSDTYDKLLILQALRNRFPEAIFFTTDLDARLLHPEENKWARNLVVASGFGLTPPPPIIKDEKSRDEEILPFRDGYQTATYLSIIAATQEGKSIDAEPDRTYAFEIGNNSAIDYSSEKLEKERVSANTDRIKITAQTYILFPLLLLFFLAFQSSNSGIKYILAFFVLVACVVLWLILTDANNSLEFQYKFSGTSIWPAVVMRMVAALIAVFSINFALVRLRNNTNKIIDVHNLPFKKRHELAERICDHFKALKFKLGDIKGLSLVLYNEIVTSLTRMASFKYIGSATIKERGYSMPSFWSRLLISTWGWRYEHSKKIGIDELMYQYMEMGRTRWWLVRVMLMFLMYRGISDLLKKIFDNTIPVTFFTGDISQEATRPVILLAVYSYLILVFLVVDVTRLNSRFVELLSRCKVQWPEDVLTKYCNDYGINKPAAVEKLKLDLIVLRSKAVDVLIFLPFIVLSLLILSRSDFFDHWHTPMRLVVIILFGAAIALSSAFRLRRSAAKARNHVLDMLDQMLKLHKFKECKLDLSKHNTETSTAKSDAALIEHKMSERIKTMIDEIKNINVGPFLPIARHPIISAIAMPFGGVGGLYLIDYFTNAGI